MAVPDYLYNPQQIFDFKISTSPYIPEEIEYIDYEEIVERTLQERWIEPLKHIVTIPFEPWIKTKIVIKKKEKKSFPIHMFGNQIICKPEMLGLIQNIGA